MKKEKIRKSSQGIVIAIGGSEDKEKDCEILKFFLSEAKKVKKNPQIVVITAATDNPEDYEQMYRKVFKKRLGVKNLVVIDVSNRQDANSEKLIAEIKRADGIFFTGGKQRHIAALLGGTQLEDAIIAQWKKGAVIAGTSAGAMSLSAIMIEEADKDVDPAPDAVTLGNGLEILKFIIDTHFAQRGRHGRLTIAVARNPRNLGVGISENTAIVYDGNQFIVIGDGGVYIVNAKQIIDTNIHLTKKGEPFSMDGVCSSFLKPGDIYDVANRKKISV